ncbi:MAG: hypothetical protein CL760_12770 [Chloroflexi bacterium]|nr:hypothetical protein [Chloroflexota bacterium]|tara:strand:+ start:36890 stop:37312 length:423 start_codon:yes stop_codon:yes gene_type:complete
MAFIRKTKGTEKKPTPIGIETEAVTLIASADMSYSQLINYLTAQDAYLALEELERNSIKDLSNSNSISVLRSVYVEEKERGKGLAKEVITEYLNSAKNDYYFLMVDIEESPTLIEFYKKFGFSVLSKDEYPIMFKNTAFE